MFKYRLIMLFEVQKGKVYHFSLKVENVYEGILFLQGLGWFQFSLDRKF
jgi:hypothetical protein